MKACLNVFFVLALSLLLTSCKEVPPLDICVSDPPANGFQCVTKKGESYFLPYAQSANHVSLPPGDFRTLTDWIKNECK